MTTSRARRWLLEPQSPADDVVGGAIAGVVITLVFRFLFGDSWPLAIGAGVAVAIASAVFSGWRRSRKSTRSTG